jgi:hypothetical protein
VAANEPPRPNGRALAGALALVALAALLPEAAAQWFAWPRLVVVAVSLGAPPAFVAAALAAYALSGRDRLMLALWLLAPLAFFNAVQGLVIVLVRALAGA